MGAKLILVSNREPYLIRRGTGGEVQMQRVSAGLIGALEPAMATMGGHWISWSGFEREAPKQGEALPERVTLSMGEKTCTLRRIPLTEREASLYYYGFGNRTLWSLMHLQLGRVQFDAEAWRAYRRVNQRFADAVAEVYEPGDRVWIHDYHLALVPSILRQAIPSIPIGFTWHVPWAPVDAVRALPWAREVIEGVLGADQVALALPRYLKQFLAAAEELAGARVAQLDESSGQVTIGERTARVGAFPIGCDYAKWEQLARHARGGRAVRLRRNLVAERLALSVDRLDHTRGMIERLKSVERFFDPYPSWRGRFVFCQVAVPSRTRVEEYREMKREVDQMVERINGRFQQGSWMPIRYQYRSFEPEELAVYYAAADIALVTPLADGLSFVPLEHMACRTREDGALVLSSLAGAADVLPGAITVNPYDEEAVATALHDALEMKPEEARRRIRMLRDWVRTHDVRDWLGGYWRAAFGEELPLGRAMEARQPGATAATLGEGAPALI